MATGTGKTLTSAAVIKLFLRTANARRVLFLVDRLELEDQAKKAFDQGRTASYPTAPLQIPACGITGPGSSKQLAFAPDTII
jgi:superfamily II DNA or RNA helicase